jgi:hypothetical protein
MISEGWRRVKEVFYTPIDLPESEPASAFENAMNVFVLGSKS